MKALLILIVGALLIGLTLWFISGGHPECNGAGQKHRPDCATTTVRP